MQPDSEHDHRRCDAKNQEFHRRKPRILDR